MFIFFIIVHNNYYKTNSKHKPTTFFVTYLAEEGIGILKTNFDIFCLSPEESILTFTH